MAFFKPYKRNYNGSFIREYQKRQVDFEAETRKIVQGHGAVFGGISAKSERETSASILKQNIYNKYQKNVTMRIVIKRVLYLHVQYGFICSYVSINVAQNAFDCRFYLMV